MSLDPRGVGRDVARRGQSMAKGFAQFLLRGKVIDLTVAVVIGAASGSLISAFVHDLFTPLVGALFHSHVQFGGRAAVIAGERVLYGDFVNQFVSFLVIAVVIYFFVIVPTNKLITNAYFEPPPDPSTRKCPDCQSEIPKIARRCAYCTSYVEPVLDEITAD